MYFLNFKWKPTKGKKKKRQANEWLTHAQPLASNYWKRRSHSRHTLSYSQPLASNYWQRRRHSRHTLSYSQPLASNYWQLRRHSRHTHGHIEATLKVTRLWVKCGRMTNDPDATATTTRPTQAHRTDQFHDSHAFRSLRHDHSRQCISNGSRRCFHGINLQ